MFLHIAAEFEAYVYFSGVWNVLYKAEGYPFSACMNAILSMKGRV